MRWKSRQAGRFHARRGDRFRRPGSDVIHRDAGGCPIIEIGNEATSDPASPPDARTVLEEWRNGLATPEHMLGVVTNDEMEIGGGAVVSEADDGYWIGTWTWVGDKG